MVGYILFNSLLDSFPCILHILPKHRTQYHLYVLDERIMPIIVAVQAHLIWIYHVVVIPYRQFLIAHRVKVNVILRLFIS